MILYACIMFAVAVVFGVLSLRIYKGKTELIHDYHQTKVKDKAAYGKAFGRALSVIAFAMAFSGKIALIGEGAMGYAVGMLVIGLLIGIIEIVRVQKKFNGGVF